MVDMCLAACCHFIICSVMVTSTGYHLVLSYMMVHLAFLPAQSLLVIVQVMPFSKPAC
jgi:hypothetical protein